MAVYGVRKPRPGYTFQCFASTQYDDKDNLFVTCSRVLEAAVGLIVTFDGARINELPYQICNFKLGKCLCLAIGISTFFASIRFMSFPDQSDAAVNDRF